MSPALRSILSDIINAKVCSTNKQRITGISGGPESDIILSHFKNLPKPGGKQMNRWSNRTAQSATYICYILCPYAFMMPWSSSFIPLSMLLMMIEIECFIWLEYSLLEIFHAIKCMRKFKRQSVMKTSNIRKLIYF